MNRRRISQKRLERLFEDLANGVIFQTVEDYREALRHLDINPKHEESLRMKEDCEEFFQSKWFSFLTLVDGVWLMHSLQEEVEGQLEKERMEYELEKERERIAYERQKIHRRAQRDRERAQRLQELRERFFGTELAPERGDRLQD